ncbi:hypothetical protein TNCV_5138021 [Trichonephila clavipes]|nr:hypothetical protein TNCV_5138021 [Trichonephila clavipes]
MIVIGPGVVDLVWWKVGVPSGGGNQWVKAKFRQLDSRISIGLWAIRLEKLSDSVEKSKLLRNKKRQLKNKITIEINKSKNNQKYEVREIEA